ncbi:DUF3331 domain-containing protein [Paraburkholderia phytofirmans]|uniref:Ribosomal protein S14 n=1 Tax=Paraburkholderia phytofirmans (strain DSM 17436 / LMG 22146 / PsJN) TaxID=398527 RepID=B2T3D7_PARPJ|nr:DUF3331 domain-containing protein [Paraburkholderia phytofirmans]ACD16098.1 conserved hypothetical protein [Paraburkholderia phytofirmans PsJN]
MLGSRIDPWGQTIRLLTSGFRCPEADADTRPVPKRGTSNGFEAMPGTGHLPHLKVSLIERTTALTVTIAWRDPTSCFYGAQVWRIANAKVSGTCVLSGQRIRRGDRIFHPQRSKPAPVNARAMILESALNAIEPLQSGPI